MREPIFSTKPPKGLKTRDWRTEPMKSCIVLPVMNTSDVFWEAISNHQVLSLYQGLGTKNLQSVIFSFIYFYGYSFFKKLYLKRSGSKSIGTKANLVLAAAAGVCTIVVTQPLNTASSRMQTSEFGKSKGLLKSLSENTWSGAFDGLGISLLLTANPSIQDSELDIIDGVGAEAGHVIRTTIGGHNGQSNYIAEHLVGIGSFGVVYQAKCREIERLSLSRRSYAIGCAIVMLLMNTSDVFWEAISNHQVLSLCQGLGTKNLQSVIFSFIYFYGYSFFKKLYLKRSGSKSIGTKANLVLAAAAGVCTIVVTQTLNTASSRMQTSEFGKFKGLWKSLSENTWSGAFDGLGISLLLTANPSIQVLDCAS
ncbi:hypothetical protein ACSBR2_030959 [Camellia fascicularis]